MQTHESYISAVAACATARLNPSEAERVQAIKLVYGSGAKGLRGVTYFERWKGKQSTGPFVEVCAFGQESWIQLAGTTVHELGHVLAGWQAGHGKEWHEACARLGLVKVLAAGTAYAKENFEPALWEQLECIPLPDDGEPIAPLALAPSGGIKAHFKACPTGRGTKGGKSYGATRMRLWECGCTPPVKVRHAGTRLNADCRDCGRHFECKAV